MKLCGNCGIQLSCGCQRRDASDGKSCCDQCINAYEISIAPIPPPPPTSIPLPVAKPAIVEEIKVEEVVLPVKTLTRRSNSDEK